MAGCTADGCDGGWHRVGDPWVQKQLAKLAPDLPADLRRSREAALRETWYPCRECQPRQFSRWVQGHWSADHDASTCEECRSLRGTPTGRTRRDRGGPTRMAVEETVPARAPTDPGDIEDF